MIVFTAVFFVVPVLFILFTASKPLVEANLMQFSVPTKWVLFENVAEAISARNHLMVVAFVNSTILTVAAVSALVLLSAMVAWIWHRRPGLSGRLVNVLVLVGLILPPAVVPTIWVLQSLGLFPTMSGLAFVEIAYGLPFSILLYRAYISTIPKDIDEAATVDGAGPIRLFFQIIFPMLKPVTISVIILQAVFVFNDFENPLYFLPGSGNETIQIALLNFKNQFLTRFNLLFASILLATIPPLILFIFFNRKIVEGMTTGSIKG